MRRTGLDYWAKVDLHVWDSLEELKQAAAPGAQFWYLSTKAPRSHWDAVFTQGTIWFWTGIPRIAGKHAERTRRYRPDYSDARRRRPQPESIHSRSCRPLRRTEKNRFIKHLLHPTSSLNASRKETKCLDTTQERWKVPEQIKYIPANGEPPDPFPIIPAHSFHPPP